MLHCYGGDSDIFFENIEPFLSRDHKLSGRYIVTNLKAKIALSFVGITCYAGNSCHLFIIVPCLGPHFLQKWLPKKILIEAYWGTDGEEVCSCSFLLSVIISLIKTYD